VDYLELTREVTLNLRNVSTALGYRCYRTIKPLQKSTAMLKVYQFANKVFDFDYCPSFSRPRPHRP
jgi:hypothetical protein